MGQLYFLFPAKEGISILKDKEGDVVIKVIAVDDEQNWLIAISNHLNKEDDIKIGWLELLTAKGVCSKINKG